MLGVGLLRRRARKNALTASSYIQIFVDYEFGVKCSKISSGSGIGGIKTDCVQWCFELSCLLLHVYVRGVWYSRRNT